MGVRRVKRNLGQRSRTHEWELRNRSQKVIPRKRSCRSGCIWTEVRANGRQPGGGARLDPKGAGPQVLRSAPRPTRDGAASELREPREAGADLRGQAHRAPNKEGRPLPGLLRVPV